MYCQLISGARKLIIFVSCKTCSPSFLFRSKIKKCWIHQLHTCLMWLLNHPRREWGCFCGPAVVRVIGLLAFLHITAVIVQESFVFTWNATGFSYQPHASEGFWLFLYWWLRRHSLLWIIKVTIWARCYASWNSTEKGGRTGEGKGLSEVVWPGVRTCCGGILKDACSGENANMKMARNERMGWMFFFGPCVASQIWAYS